jgi:ABC-2 type transport system ATP-binding protein
MALRMPGRRSPPGHSFCNRAVTAEALEPLTMTHDTVLVARGLGKRYRRRWALSDCTLAVPAGRVVGLVGPNGAGKTTLMRLAVGLLAPSAGTVEVLGGRPAESPAQIGRVGFVAQDTPTYANLSVADHLRLGGWLNARWDRGLAQRRIEQAGLDPRQRAGRLSGGQRAQLALALAVAKQPDLLVLDEPVASLDPLARREFLQGISDVVAGHGVSVVLSSHLVADLERVCDFVIVLVASRVRVAGTIEELLATHHRLIGPRHQDIAGGQVVEARHTDEHSTLLVRSDRPIVDPRWTVEPVSLEDIVLAYMGTEVRS